MFPVIFIFCAKEDLFVDCGSFFDEFLKILKHRMKVEGMGIFIVIFYLKF